MSSPIEYSIIRLSAVDILHGKVTGSVWTLSSVFSRGNLVFKAKYAKEFSSTRGMHSKRVEPYSAEIFCMHDDIDS